VISRICILLYFTCLAYTIGYSRGANSVRDAACDIRQATIDQAVLYDALVPANNALKDAKQSLEILTQINPDMKAKECVIPRRVKP
jgi:hypothetical protein